MSYIKNIRNIGILAHVDAGKTSTTENFLFLGKAVKELGNVDKGTSQTDFYAVEKERGISVVSSTTYFNWKDITVNLIDTPGHVDFSSEVERSLTVLDGVIIVISAVEGIQAQTEVILEATQKLNIPTIIFINKIDRPGSDVSLITEKLKNEKGVNVFYSQKIDNEGEQNANVSSIWSESNLNNSSNLIETIAETNDDLLERYFENDNLSFQELEDALKDAFINCNIIPVLSGSAKNSVGIEELLNNVINLIPSPIGDESKELSGRVFSIRHDKELGKVAGIRIYNGTLNIRDEVLVGGAVKEKINRIRFYQGDSFEQKDLIRAGEVAYVGGLSSAKPGDVIGESDLDFKNYSFDSPLLMVKVEAENDADFSSLLEAMSILNAEDPQLELQKDDKEIIIRIRGAIQSQIIKSLLESRFDVEASISNPEIIYKETVSKPVYGYANYTMPKPCWAVLKFLIEPIERGAGVQYSSKVRVDDIKHRFQNETENCIDSALQQGVKGWEVTDVKITLVEGEDHEIHSRPGNFIIATNMALMNGLDEAGTTLLEPVMSFVITSPEEHLGAIAGDLHKMRAEFDTPEFNNSQVRITGKIPLATSIEYPIRLGSLTSGMGVYSSRLYGYQEISDDQGKIREYRGISPLDRSKYILKMRGAIK